MNLSICLVLVVFLFSIGSFQRIGFEIVRITNISREEIDELRTVIPFKVEIDEEGKLGLDINFHNCYVFLPSLSAKAYMELAQSNTIISSRVKEIQEVLMLMFNDLVYKCFKPLSETMAPTFDNCRGIFQYANKTLVLMSVGIRKIRGKIEIDIAKVNEQLYHPVTGLYTQWDRYVSSEWPVYQSNIMGGYTRMILYMKNAVYTKFVVDFFLISIFGIWVLLYISRFFPKKPTFRRILDSYAIPAFPLFIISGVGEIILGVCVVYDPSGIQRYFIRDALLTLFFVVGVFILFQFFVITVWIICLLVKVVKYLVKGNNGNNIEDEEAETAAAANQQEEISDEKEKMKKGYIINEER